MRALSYALLATFLATGCGSTNDTPTPSQNANSLDPPAHGVQLHIAKFAVPPGKEIQHCYYFKLPSDVDLEVVRFEIAYRQGSHHMNLFRTTKDYPDHDEECFTPMDFSTPTNPDGVDLIVGSQTGNLDWKMPAGVAFKLKAKTQLVLQTHYVNASTQKTAEDNSGEVWVNIHDAIDKASIKSHVGTMFANNMQIKIPAHQNASFTTGCAVPSEANVIAVTGHFHSRGRQFMIAACPNSMKEADPPFYASRSWSEPPFQVLDKPVHVNAGGGLEYTCAFENGSDTEIVFGPKVETQEHCNLFAYFYPWEEAHTRYCF